MAQSKSLDLPQQYPFAAPPNSDAGFLRCLCYVEDQIQMKPNHVYDDDDDDTTMPLFFLFLMVH